MLELQNFFMSRHSRYLSTNKTRVAILLLAHLEKLLVHLKVIIVHVKVIVRLSIAADLKASPLANADMAVLLAMLTKE